MSSKVAGSGERVRRARVARGVSQSALALSAGISRQALGAIESGSYQPGVATALRLARELGETVESLFGDTAGASVEATLASGSAPQRSRVALARVGGRVVATPVPRAALELVPAGGIVSSVRNGHAAVDSFVSSSEIDSTLLVAGCDPAVTILADWIARRRHPVALVALGGSSQSALDALAKGRAHAAGIHLRDPRSGEYNLTAVRRALGHRRALVVNFARWELGLAMKKGNPLGIRGFDDLARPRVRLANREAGSGARIALDAALADSKIDARKIAGYRAELRGHLEVAAAIADDYADAGVTIRVAAEAYGLDFISIREERYDIAITEREMESVPVAAMLEALNSSWFARQVKELCAYDTREMGKIVGRVA
jgi:putative molybdopterin biosynthesis protein